MAYLSDPMKSEQSLVMYMAYVVPVCSWILYTVGSWLPMTLKIKREQLIVGSFLLLVYAVSFARADWSSFVGPTLFILCVLVIHLTRVTISLNLMNGLFLFTLCGSIVAYHTGYSIYGYLPGQSSVQFAESDGSWRISLFPFVPQSGFFAFLVLTCNVLFNKTRSKWLFVTLALYFLIFTGMRSSFIALLFLILFYFLSRSMPFKPSPFYRWYNWLSLLGFVLILNMNAILFGLAFQLKSPLVNKILFRTETSVKDVEQLQKTIYRTWIWSKHIELFQRSPLTGIGTFDFETEISERLDSAGTNGSESTITIMLARFGIITFIFLAFMHRLNTLATLNQRRYSFYMIFFFLLIMLTYGSFLVPYNFMFLLIWGLYNGNGVITTQLIEKPEGESLHEGSAQSV